MSLFYHVPVTYRIESGPIKARPLHGGKYRRSETEELKSDLRSEGWPPDSPIVWLSPRKPVSKSGPCYVIDPDALEEERLIPTYTADGYYLHVGDIPETAIVDTYERKGLQEQIRTLIREVTGTSSVQVEVTPKDMVTAYRAGRFEKSDGNLRGIILDDVPMYRIVDDLGMYMIEKSQGRITSGNYSVKLERKHGAQFAFGLDEVVKFGIGYHKPRWRVGKYGDGTTYDPDYYPGRLQGGLWVLEISPLYHQFFALSYPGRDAFEGPVNPFAEPGSADFDQKTHDMILDYIKDMSDEHHDELEQHLKSLNLRLKKSAATTSLGFSIHARTTDVNKVFKVALDPTGGYNLKAMTIEAAQAEIKTNPINRQADHMPIRPKLPPFVKEDLVREYIIKCIQWDT